MDILKSTKKLSVVFTIAISGFLNAQESTITAFKESYTLEYNKEYSKAIVKMKSVYDPDAYEINLRLGWLNYLSGQLDESSNYYSKAITLKPYAIEPRFGLIKTLTAQGKWDGVLALYTKIIEIDPQNTTANYQIGFIYFTRLNYERADVYLERVVNLYPFDYNSLLLLAWNKYYLQKTKEAKVLFGKVLFYNPEDKSALEGLKLIHSN